MNKPVNRLSAAISLVLLALSGSSAAESLTQVYQQALQNAPQLRAAQAGYEAAQEAIPQSKANFLPVISAGASHTENFKDEQTDYQTYALELEQNLYNRSFNVQRNLAASSVGAAKATLDDAGLTLILDVSSGYFAVLSALDSLEFAEAEKAANARQLEQTQQRFEVGLVAITDVHESQAAYDISVASAIEAGAAVDNAREQLRAITGKYHESLNALTDSLPLVEPVPAGLQTWTDMAVSQNPALIAAQQGTQQAQHNVELQRSSKYPTAGLSLRHAEIEGNDLASDGTTAMLSLNYRFYEGGANDSRISQARAQQRQSQELYEQLKRTTESQVRNAYRGVQSGISRVRALNQAVISAQTALRAAEAGYEVGTRTTVDVLVARSNLFDAQRNYAQARYNYILSTLELRRAAGVLSEADLQSLDSWLK